MTRSKLLVTFWSAIAGLVVYYIATEMVEVVQTIHARHPDLGVTGWLLILIWFAGAVALSMVIDAVFKSKGESDVGDRLSLIAMMLYMTISGMIYLISMRV